MPYKVDFRSRGDSIIDALCQLLLRGGVPALSLRAVAAEIEMSASSILHQFGDRARLLHVATVRTGSKRLHDIEWFAVRSGPGAFLPATQAELDRDRVWLALGELARTHQGLGEVIAHLREEQGRILALATGLEVGAPELVALSALIDGLVAAMVTGVPPLSLDQARKALGSHLLMVGLAREHGRAPVARMVDERSTTPDAAPPVAD